MEAAGGRRVRSVEGYLHLFPAPTGNDIVIRKSADVDDTVNFIKKKVPEASWQTEKFSKYIKGKTLDETCGNIWQWLYDHIPYKKDEDGIEQIRSPRRLVYEGSKTGVDCDCYSFTISCILWNLKIPHKYRITKYLKADGSEPRWQHIYIVVPKNGKLNKELSERKDYIVIDCVKNGYDEEEPYLEFNDTNMRLDYLDGLEGDEYEVPGSMDAQDMAAIYDEEELGKIGQWVKKAAKNTVKVVKKGVQVAKKVGASPLRNTILLAMKINFLNVAKRLRYGYLSDEQAKKLNLNPSGLAKVRKVRAKAEDIFVKAGGKKENLRLAMLKGHGNKDKKVPLAGLGMLYNGMDEEENQIINGGDLGVLPAAAALATITPIFTALATSLKSVKDLFPKNSPEAKNFQSDSEPAMPATISPAQIAQASEESIVEAPITKLSTQSSARVAAPEEDQAENMQNSLTTTSKSLPAAQGADAGAENNATPKEGFFQKAGGWIKANPLPTALIVAGVGGAIYFITKKKKSAGLSGFTPHNKTRPKSKSKGRKRTKSKIKTYSRVNIL